ncbi:pyridoxamine 5'-phosphate oxidase family protein [Halostreptopolyspora alba]|uniref:Pyridoxamine 5'-phosphate oxidase family protein n=1 Tax=Halostreptopolyspora alba TaxID=2487137 RepID=A0A3N0EIS7_9ACTN|nr:pyridoxamine 5'-phosphate oxidase family protein [Nocardiopsaceae bacterium YIM 96095]
MMTNVARAEPFDPAGGTPEPWERALTELAGAQTYWLSTVCPEGRPHAVPLLAVVVGGTVHFCASGRSRKARNLDADARCVITTSGPGLDLVVQGEAAPLTGAAELGDVAGSYATKYGWSPTARDGALWAEGAPTAGPPPYRVYAVVPTVVFGFPTDESSTPTRWRF